MFPYLKRRHLSVQAFSFIAKFYCLVYPDLQNETDTHSLQKESINQYKHVIIKNSKSHSFLFFYYNGTFNGQKIFIVNGKMGDYDCWQYLDIEGNSLVNEVIF